ncbi:Piso0_002181 [Millerozyma farinosa CBS 7064]|uniref:Piso0_002181 protein n=1 Tax=Pichia sorbitophila (strain ATCC MYA-4447 / BCRC 22081 / CBS 7064 / NBRC 10061 / NRRL Y-12695) TaxID=559304 RepID=G8YEC3_PICSO|nr:Piso0_002181 [Millerozyma farinosa CBS 7064]
MMSRNMILGRQFSRAFSSSTKRLIAVGEKIPSASLYESSPGNEVTLAEEVAKGKSVIVGVPGAFSPACSASHVPGYLKNLRGFNDKGYTKFFIVSVNDPFVMKAWGSQLLENVGSSQVKFLADPRAEFSTALDLKFDATKVFGNERSKRYALLVEDGKVTQTFIEPDNTSVNVSDATKVLSQL